MVSCYQAGTAHTQEGAWAMPLPTKYMLEKHQFAVVALVVDWQEVTEHAAVESISARDYEWFDSDTQRSEFFTLQVDWCKNEHATGQDDIHYLIAEVLDTNAEPMTLGRVQAFTGEDNTELAREWVRWVKANPEVLIQPGGRKVKAKAKTEAKGAVRKRKPSKAAEEAKSSKDDGAAPEPKASKVRARRAPATQAQAEPEKEVAEQTTDGADKRKEALRKRIVAKQAEGVTDAEDIVEAVAEETAEVLAEAVPDTDKETADTSA